MKNVEISPSIISSDLLDLGNQIKQCQQAGAGSFHLDVMDGHFVDNITMGPELVSSIRRGTDLRLDCHLMIERPDKYYKAFLKAGCDVLLIHYETPIEIAEFFKKLEKEEIKYGIVINPDTDVNKILKFVPFSEIVLVMSVYPGFSGQKFIESSLDKVRILRKYIDDNLYSTKIEIDGGINDHTGKLAVEAGADILVSASYIFNNGISESIKKLKSL
ncbi:ribulose-phosphate 3-epimerase [Ferroplasma sp.]|uniref:ribulose-phosphate 3-epimerase n=1 Tax=Ferroplasma sp. TaxID=2591003 RepID=UPI00307D390F